MGESCKTCRKKFESGIWLSPEFADEKVFLFCSDNCKKKYLKINLRRIKTQYPKHYKKIKEGKIESIYREVIKNE